MKSMVAKKTLIITIIFFVILSTVAGFGGFIIGKTSAEANSVKQYLLMEDVDVGHSLKGKYKEVYVSNKTSVESSNLVLDENIIANGVAAHKMYANSPITVTDVTTLEALDRNIEVSFPVSVTGSIANSIKPGDVVAVKLTYKDENKKDAVVVPQVTVKAVKSTSGTPVLDENTVVGYVIFDVTSEESSDVNNAMKEGSLYCAKYTDLSEKPLEKTYSIGASVDAERENTSTTSANTGSN